MIPAHLLVSQDALRRYDQDGEPALTTSERVLLRLRHFDWIDACEFLDVFCDDLENIRQRQLVSVTISQLIARGRVEARHNGKGSPRVIRVRR